MRAPGRRKPSVTALVALVAALSAAGCSSESPGEPDDDTTTVCDVQAYEDDGTSPLDGHVVTIQGAVTALRLPDGLGGFSCLRQGDCGIYVHCYSLPSPPPSLGDVVEVTGTVGDAIDADGSWGPCTVVDVASADYCVTLSTGNPAPEPFDMSVADVSHEDNEGSLVRVAGVVTSMAPPWHMLLQDPTGTIEIYRGGNAEVDLSAFAVGDTLIVAGVVGQCDWDPPHLGGYQVLPRSQIDLVRMSQRDPA